MMYNNPMIKVKINEKLRKGYFDTGAGITIVSESFAKKNNVQLLEERGYANSASNKTIPFKVGYIPKIQIGEFVALNHPVGIVKDELMEFKILGIKVVDIDLVIGWTLIQEMAFRIDYKKNKLALYNPDSLESKTSVTPNLFWFNAPILILSSSLCKGNLYFDIDLGGSESNIYPYIMHKLSDTTQVYTSEKKFGGAGGFTDYKAYIIPKFELQIKDKHIFFNNIRSRPLPNTFDRFKLDGVVGGNVAKDFKLFMNPKGGEFYLSN